MVSWKVQSKRLDLQSPGSSPMLWGGTMTSHILGRGTTQSCTPLLLYLCSDILPQHCFTESHRKVVNSQNDQLVANQALLVR